MSNKIDEEFFERYNQRDPLMYILEIFNSPDIRHWIVTNKFLSLIRELRIFAIFVHSFNTRNKHRELSELSYEQIYLINFTHF